MTTMRKQLLIIPALSRLEESQKLAEEYSVGYEYNDFFAPDVLDSPERQREIAEQYAEHGIPCFATLHGAFFDVIPCSVDRLIAQTSDMRIEQSIAAAELMRASGVVFHTNYNPFLNSPAYIADWIRQNADYWSGVLARHKGVQIWLENMFDTSPDIMERLAELLCSCDNFGICLDYAHASLSKVAAPVWAEKLGKYVRHVHINDNDLASDLHLVWGSGRIDRAAFYESYRRYLAGATVLVETSSPENQRKSLEKLEEEGFI